jgi:hypothetical protein
MGKRMDEMDQMDHMDRDSSLITHLSSLIPYLSSLSLLPLSGEDFDRLACHADMVVGLVPLEL